MDQSLSVAHKLSIYGSFLRPQVVGKDLVEALKTNSSCVRLLVFTNLCATPRAQY